MKYLAILCAVLCLILSGCDGLTEDDRKEVDEIGAKSEADQKKMADDLVDRAKKEQEEYDKLSDKEKESKHRTETAHKNKLFFLFAEVRENEVVSEKAIKRVKPALPFFKRLAELDDKTHALDSRIKLVEESK